MSAKNGKSMKDALYPKYDPYEEGYLKIDGIETKHKLFSSNNSLILTRSAFHLLSLLW